MTNHTMDLHFGPDGSPQLKNIVIHSFGTQRFSGLLGLKNKQDSLYFVLLDATGIKLLEIEMEQDGQYIIKNGLKKLTDGSLPEILAKSLRRIYIIEPLETPCSTHLLHKLCSELSDDGKRLKYSRTWPFTLWKVFYDGSVEHKITYTQPWLGFSLTLSKAD